MQAERASFVLKQRVESFVIRSKKTAGRYAAPHFHRDVSAGGRNSPKKVIKNVRYRPVLVDVYWLNEDEQGGSET